MALILKLDETTSYKMFMFRVCWERYLNVIFAVSSVKGRETWRCTTEYTLARGRTPADMPSVRTGSRHRATGPGMRGHVSGENVGENIF